MRVQQISKTGTSLCVTIPKRYLAKLGLHHRDYIVLSLLDKQLRIEALDDFHERERKEKEGR